MTEKATSGKATWKRVVQALISIGIVVGIFIGVLPRFASYSDVWATIRDMTGLELFGLVMAGVWNIVTYWFVMVAVLPGLKYRQAAVVNQASTAVANTLPGGGAIGVGVTYAMYTSWGFGKAEIALSALVSGIWNNFAKLGFPVAALALLALSGDLTPARITAAVVGIAVLAGAVVGFCLVLKSDRLARAVGTRLGAVVSRLRGLLRRDPVGDWGASAAAFREETIGLLRTRWLALTVATAISHFSLFAVLWLTIRNVVPGDTPVSMIQVFAAFAFVRLISAIPITPGGLGVVELGYTAALTIGLSAVSEANIVAAVLLFRAITFFMPIPFGAIAYTFWRRNRSWRMTEAERLALEAG
ncbi:MAG: YbhN family protein [Acidimicrobiia bacterium]|nr:YbhN family protein [Acidimicrobiia bacterium]